MTLLTVDAKLMPILPLIARPDATDALVVAFGMGSAFRSALIAGLATDVVELVPSVPRMFGYYYDDAAAILKDPRGQVIVADGRNHLELNAKTYDIIVTDPPPPIESSGATVISSLEYFQAGRDRLNEGGIMMQWVPYSRQPVECAISVRTFASVFPHVTIVKGPGGYGAYLLGSSQPISFDEADVRRGPRTPGRSDGHLLGLRLARARQSTIGSTSSPGKHGSPMPRRATFAGTGLDRHRRPAADRVLPASTSVRVGLSLSGCAGNQRQDLVLASIGDLPVPDRGACLSGSRPIS